MITIQSNDGSVCDITSESAKNGQVADVRAESDAAQLNTTEASRDTQKKPQGKSAPQSARENARYAAARRSAERERDEEIRRARENAEHEIERRVAEALGRRDSDGNTEVNTVAASTATANSTANSTALSTATAETVVANATAAGMDAEATADSQTSAAELGQADDSSSVTLTSLDREAGEVSRVREIGERLTEERTRIALESEIARVRGHFPEIKNLLDIVKLERYPEVKSMVERGYALSDAVRLAYEDVYVRRRTSAAAAQVRGELSTSHMKPTSPTSASSHDVSEAQIRTYLSSVPGATRESAIKAYQKYKIGTRKV